MPRIKQALIRDKRHPGLYLMPSAQTRDKTAVTPGQMIKVIDHLREQFDYIILDCPAGIEQGFQNAIAGADRALVVTTPEVSAIRDADRIIGLLEANGFKQMDLIINRLRMDMVRRGDMMFADDVVDILAIPLIGIIPDDENVVIATNQGEPLVGTDTPAGKAYFNVVERLRGRGIFPSGFRKGSIFLDESNRYFSKSIGRGRMNMKHFFSQEKFLPGCKRPFEDPSDIGPGKLFPRNDGTDQGGHYQSDFQIHENRYRPYGDRDTGKRRQQKREKSIPQPDCKYTDS